VFFGLAHNKLQNNFKKNLQTKNKLKLKHLEIEWNLKKTSSFPTLAQSKRERQYQFEEQSKTTRCMEEQRNKNSRIRRPRINKEEAPKEQ
jgi:hypothetical protein